MLEAAISSARPAAAQLTIPADMRSALVTSPGLAGELKTALFQYHGAQGVRRAYCLRDGVGHYMSCAVRQAEATS